LVGFGGTLVLHGIAAALFIPDTPTHKLRPPDTAGVTAARAHIAPVDDLVLVNITTSKKSERDLAATRVDLRFELSKLAIPPVMPDWKPAIDLSGPDSDAENSNQSDANPGDAELRARMFGRYTGQISARIERAWEKPRSPVNDSPARRSANAVEADTFVCQVEIRQDGKGNVQEVLLLACNGTEAWRHSLVVAINQSSPLPAPPIPTVFKRAITLTFEGRADQQAPLPQVAAVEPRGMSR
jgi:hypothetical protein